jgi:transcriptional regulator with XRE-family HTH domain
MIITRYQFESNGKLIMAFSLRDTLPKQIKERNLSISAFEKMADLPKNAVHNIISGHTKNPSARTLQKIADLLGCNVKDLLEGKDFGVDNLQVHKRPSLPSLKTEEKVIYIEDHDLFHEISSYFTQYLKNKGAKPDLNGLLHSISETYTFCYFKNDKNFDRRFADWSIEKIL